MLYKILYHAMITCSRWKAMYKRSNDTECPGQNWTGSIPDKRDNEQETDAGLRMSRNRKIKGKTLK